jgi:hypothetical protein
MTAETAAAHTALTRHYDTLATQAKDTTRREIDQLRSYLVALEAALAKDMRPAVDLSGDLGLVAKAANVQRSVDAWLSHSQSARVVRNVLED